MEPGQLDTRRNSRRRHLNGGENDRDTSQTGLNASRSNRDSRPNRLDACRV